MLFNKFRKLIVWQNILSGMWQLIVLYTRPDRQQQIWGYDWCSVGSYLNKTTSSFYEILGNDSSASTLTSRERVVTYQVILACLEELQREYFVVIKICKITLPCLWQKVYKGRRVLQWTYFVSKVYVCMYLSKMLSFKRFWLNVAWKSFLHRVCGLAYILSWPMVISSSVNELFVAV